MNSIGFYHYCDLSRLTKNEKLVLKHLIEDAAQSNTEIAEKLGISTQMIGRIKKKLSEEGFISKYSIDLNFEKMGLNVFSISLFKITKEAWQNLGDEGVKKRILSSPHIVQAFRVSGSDVTHILMHSFRTLSDMENYFMALEENPEAGFEIKGHFTFSSKGLLKNSYKELMEKIITKPGEEAVPLPF